MFSNERFKVMSIFGCLTEPKADATIKREGIFDYIATTMETAIVKKLTEPVQFNWDIDDKRPIFRISSTASLSRDYTNHNKGIEPTIYRQRTIIASTTSGSSIGGLVYPMKVLNASYDFQSVNDETVKDDYEKLFSILDKPVPAVSPTAYEWDLGLYYKPKEDGAPLKTVRAFRTDAKFKPLIRPQFSPALPIPSKKQDWRCIDSGTTRETLLSLNAALASGSPPL